MSNPADMDERARKRVEELILEEISSVCYSPAWHRKFEDRAGFLKKKLPQNFLRRIEHFDTAI